VRIVDCFTDVILFTRKFVRSEAEGNSVEEVKDHLINLFDKSQQAAKDLGMTEEFYQQAKYPVVALVDELLQCSNWKLKAEWQKNSLQRYYFETTSAGAEFYDRLNVLNKFGPDRDIREVYALCLGLGFKGRYFRGEDRKAYEEIKAFNLSLLLPDEAQRNIDSATLFPFAYKGHEDEENHSFKSRLNIYPVIIGVPLVVIITLIIVYQLNIVDLLDQVQNLLNY
jgi:type VI secretion system protein ImpK